MPADESLPWEFLGEAASEAQIMEAMVENMRCWVARCALANGGEVQETPEVSWAYSPGPEGDAAILFPRFSINGKNGKNGKNRKNGKNTEASSELDQILHYFRRKSPVRDLLCWSLDPTTPPDLEARLLARNFSWNWRPHWMWLTLSHLQSVQSRVPGLHIEIVERLPLWEVDDLPYYSPTSAPHLYQTTRQEPRRVWHFAAWLAGRVVGQSRLNLTTGSLGVAGIFDVGVVPAARNQGIGKALTLAACHLARSLGCRHALLNASEPGEPVYRKLGFVSLGYGKTWLLRRPALIALPQPAQIRFIEALATGNLTELDLLAPTLDPTLYTQPLASGLTPLQIVVGLQQPCSAEWLFARGVPLDLLSAWDLGWHERAEALLQHDPQQANQRYGERGITALHSAVERNDPALASLVLSAHPDLSLKDGDFKATPLDWAHYLDRKEMALLLEQFS